jgi:hypothetical protein
MFAFSDVTEGNLNKLEEISPVLSNFIVQMINVSSSLQT